MISEKIVIIDDDREIIKSLEIGLPEYEIIGFTRGDEALKYLRRPNEVNLALVDIHLDDMDGIDILNEIKENIKGIRVIIMTGQSTKDTAIDALRNKADEYVEKPFSLKELKEKIRTLLRNELYAQKPNRDKNQHVDRIKKFVSRYYKEINLDLIADEMNMSPKYISRMFSQNSDINFRQLKIKVKMNEAESLLKNTSLNIDEISYQLGYQNSESFMRIFKRMYELTPTQYRRKQEKKSSRK